MQVALLSLVVFGCAFAALAVGVIFSRDKELKGSCGGPQANPDCCMKCPDKQPCDEVKGLDVDVPAAKTGPHPLLAQAPSAGSDRGAPVATSHR